jgi:lysophospholipase L1-like esterase
MWRELLKSIVFILIAIILALSGIIYPAAVSAQAVYTTPQPAYSTANNNDLTQLIQCGLFAGSNGELQGCPAYVAPPAALNQVIVPVMSTSSTYSYPTNSYYPTSNYSASPTNLAVATNGTYVALGDSVAAGLGLAANANATSQDTLCGRSTQGYPNLVAQRLGMPLINYSCSGATVGDLVTQQTLNGQKISAQLDMAFSQGVPSLITITAGANDINWDYFIRYCYAYDCATPANTLLLNTYLYALNYKLYYALNSIAQRSGSTPPRVILTGYYNPISSRCVNMQQQLTSNEISWLNSASGALNQTINNVHSRFAFSKYASISFSGYDICSQNPWVQGLSAAAPFHPTPYGQQQIANIVVSSATH